MASSTWQLVQRVEEDIVCFRRKLAICFTVESDDFWELLRVHDWGAWGLRWGRVFAWGRGVMPKPLSMMLSGMEHGRPPPMAPPSNKSHKHDNCSNNKLVVNTSGSGVGMMNYPHDHPGSSSSCPPQIQMQLQLQFPPNMMQLPFPMMIMDPSSSSFFPSHPMTNNAIMMYPHPQQQQQQQQLVDDIHSTVPSTPTPSSSRSSNNRSKKYHPHTCTVHIPGLPHAVDIPFPERRLPVCDKCKKNFKSRDLCRKRDGHKALPWQTTYVVVTLDDSALEVTSNDESNNNNSNNNNINDITGNTVSSSNNSSIQKNDGTTTTINTSTLPHIMHHHPSSPPTAILLPSLPNICMGPSDGSMSSEPICKSCREKNYTRDYCRNTCQHTYPPWGTTYVKLVVKDRQGLGAVVAGGNGGHGDGDEDDEKLTKKLRYSIPSPNTTVKRRKKNPELLHVSGVGGSTITNTTNGDYDITQQDASIHHHMDPSNLLVDGDTATSATTTNTNNNNSNNTTMGMKVEEGEQHQHHKNSDEKSDDLTKIHPSKTFFMAISSKKMTVRVSRFS